MFIKVEGSSHNIVTSEQCGTVNFPPKLFRHGVLGSLISRNKIERGELKKLICEAANRDYDIPGSIHTRVAEKTIDD